MTNEKRLTRTERTYLRQHRKCIDPRYGKFKATNNKSYSKYCTWFSLYSWYDKGIKLNRLSKDELKFISQYKTPSEFANAYLVINEDGKYEYCNLKEDETKIELPIINGNYTVSKLSKVIKIKLRTCYNYLNYIKINIIEDTNGNYITKGDAEKLIEWCNTYSKNERYNMICEQTFLNNYGVKHPLQSKDIQNKAKITCKEHYGVEHPSQSKEVQDTFLQTNLMTYGVENPSQSQIIKDRKTETTMEHYGVENPFQAEDVIKISKQTKIEKYGTTVTVAHYRYNNIGFHSKEEVYFYIYHHNILKDDITRGKIFKYYVDGISHNYECDFFVNGENIEIKGRHLIDRKTMILHTFKDKIPQLEKTQCLRDNNVKIYIDDDEEIIRISKIVEEKFPNLVKSCRIKNKQKDKKKNKFRKSKSTYDITNTIFDL